MELQKKEQEMQKTQEQSKNSLHFYEIQVGGIRCTNCANKISTNLEKINDNINKVIVNVMQEKVQVEISTKNKNDLENETQISNQDTNILLDDIQNKLKDLNFTVLQQPRKLNLYNDSNLRDIHLLFDKNSIQDKSILTNQLNDIPGVVSVNIANSEFDKDNKIPVVISYNTEITKARFINSELKDKLKLDYIVNDDIYLAQFKNNSGNNFVSLSICEFLQALFLIFILSSFTMVLPRFMSTEAYNFFISYPSEQGLISIYSITIFIAFVYSIKIFGMPVYKDAYFGYRDYKSLTMETLITLGSLSSILMAFYLIIQFTVIEQEHIKQSEKMNRLMQIKKIAMLFQAASLIVLIVTLGKYIEGKAKENIIKMMDSIFPTTQLITDKIYKFIEPKNRNLVIKEESDVNISLLDKNDLIKIKAPMKLLVDGIVLKTGDDQNSEQSQLKVIDSVCFGSEHAFKVTKGDRIKSGSSIDSGEGILQVENTVDNCLLFKISQEMNQAHNKTNEASQQGMNVILKSVSEYFIKGVIYFSIIVLFVWIGLLSLDIVESNDINKFCTYCIPFERAISVLVASCPCALGLAIPCVVAITLNIAIQNNTLIKNTQTFEKLMQVQSIVFDKTGTLFNKVDKIKDVYFEESNIMNQQKVDDIWQIITLIEKESVHPLAEVLYKQGLSELMNPQNLGYIKVDKVQQLEKGIQCEVQRKSDGLKMDVKLGNLHFMQEVSQIEVFGQIQKKLESNNEKGLTSIFVSINGLIVAIIGLDNAKNLRPEAKSVVLYLKNKLKKDIYILSGDSKESVNKVGDFLEIPRENLFGESNQNDKLTIIRNIKKNAKNPNKSEVMMIGDGLNDILSIQEAGVGVSINAKSELNLAASDVIFLNQNLWKLPSLFNLISVSRTFIKINLFSAFFYNLIMIPLSSGLLYNYNIVISPTIASFCMSFSSLFVVLFSNLLRVFNFDLQQQKQNQQQIKTSYTELVEDVIHEQQK